MNNRVLKVIVLLIASLGVSSLALAQSKLVVEAPKVVSQDETFRLIFTALGKGDDFTPPVIEGFDVLVGPSVSTTSRTNIVNGKRTDSQETSYTYILRAREEGTFSISSASVKIDGAEHKSNPISIEVVKAEVSSGTNPATSPSDQSSSEISNDDIFMRLTLDKRRVMIGEPIVATLKLYSRVNINGFEDIKFPTFNGFWSQEIETPTNITFERENVDGKIYSAGVLRKYVLIPQQTGTIEIDQAEMVCQVEVRNTSSSPRSLFDSFFDNFRTVRKRVYSPKVRVEVSSLPAGAPASFTGGVGDFSMDVKLSRDSLKAHEAASLTITINGNGNINLIDAPKVDFPADFEVYDVKRSENISRTSGGTRGSRTFEIPFIPRSYGTFNLDPVEFTYYSISQKKYVTLRSQPLTVKVAQGADNNNSIANPSSVGRQSVRTIGDDIRYIVTKDNHLLLKDRLFAGSLSYLITLAILVILYGVLYYILSKRIKMREDVSGTRNRKAKKIAKARLKNASILLKQNLYSAFYEELYKALLGYISDKLLIPVADLSRDNIEEKMRSQGVSEEVIQRLIILMDQCEYARYAPSAGFTEMEQHYNEAIKLISDIEDKF